MGTVTFPSVLTTSITAALGSTLTIGLTIFPESDADAGPRATASFSDGQTASEFASRSQRQLVETATADIQPGTTIVGVNYNGKVDLSFTDSAVVLTDIYIVDEGGFCSATNTITATSVVSGSITMTNAYSFIRARTNGTEWFTEASATVINTDGSSATTDPETGDVTVVDASGNTTTTSADGNTTVEILADGTTSETVVSSKTTTISVVSPDGTTTDTESSSNGSSTTQIVSPDGTVEDTEVSSNGNSSSVTVSPDGTVVMEDISTNGRLETSSISPDGSTYSSSTTPNGKVTITTVDTSGVEIVKLYIPWKTFHTVTTTPPGTTVQVSTNPYYTG